MKLIVPVLMNIALVICIYLLNKKRIIKNTNALLSQIIIGLCFGAISAFASDFGEDIGGVVINVRDASPIASGLIFGPIAGIIAGLIGGTYRALSVLWGAGTYTVVACTISTIVAGLVVAILRRYMFDDKKPTLMYAVGITIVLEVFHMLMIFITNFNDANTAFHFVRQCTIPMIIANSVAVGVSIFATSLINKDFKFKRSKKEKGITDTFQVWLFASIVVAFGVTSVFTFNLQSTMTDKNVQSVFSVSMTDAGTDIMERSNAEMLEILEEVKENYLEDEDVYLESLLYSNDYHITEINIISSDGIIYKSSDYSNIGWDMRNSEQSREFLAYFELNPDKNEYVQLYGKNGKGLDRKYAASLLPNGDMIQIGYGANQFHEKLDSFVISATKNRHVGAEGFIAICDENLNLVIDDDKYQDKHISTIGIIPNEEMLNKEMSSEIYVSEIIDSNGNVVDEYLYVFAFVEGYCMIAALPSIEAMLMRDASMYLSLFMQVLIFASLFILIFYLIKKIIINNLHKINENLAEITGGNLNVKVDVRTSEEFSSLSDDINSTVSTLKQYIAEAAARIDKELEYAKQIQLSALPTNFADNNKYGIFASMIAAKEVGGDFYDFYKIDENHIAFLVADVSGKGIPAAMFMMTAKTIIKDLAEAGYEVNDIFTKANQKLCENNESGMFVTAWMGILNIETGLLQYANAGHNPPLILKNGEEFSYLKTRAGFILGGMEGIKYKKFEIELNKGDRIFLYTDGVPEATDIEQKLYGEDRLLNYMNQNKTLSSKELLPKLKEDIDLFVGEAPQFDDITMLMFDYRKAKEDIFIKTYKADDKELNNVLSMFEERLEKYECSIKNITSICVAIEEIFVNIAHYAYGKETGDCKFSIKFNQDSRELTIIMEDTGIPFNPLTKEDPDIGLSAEDREIGGLGIYIVKKTMDSITYRYEDNTNILTMKKFI